MHLNERLFEGLDNVDSILVFNRRKSNSDFSFFHLVQPHSGTFENSFAIVSRDSVKVITSILEKPAAEETGLEVLAFRTMKERDELLKRELAASSVIGLNYSAISKQSFDEFASVFQGKNFKDVSKNLSEARMYKTPEEIGNLREANRIASEAFGKVVDDLRIGITESEVSALLAYEMMKLGASNTSFNGVIAFGENSAVPHHHPTDRKLQAGDFAVMDFGALYHGYCSDVTRTIVAGKATEEQKAIYDLVLKAQNEAIQAIRGGISGREIDSISRKIIDSSKYKGTFIHGLGHGVGLEVHDHPALSQGSELILQENMVVTVEPGIYIKGYGGVRIEDDVVVHRDRVENLTTAEKKLIEI